MCSAATCCIPPCSKVMDQFMPGHSIALPNGRHTAFITVCDWHSTTSGSHLLQLTALDHAGTTAAAPPAATMEMPSTWVPRLVVPREVLDTRAPKGNKKVIYQFSEHETFALFGETSKFDGCTERLTIFSDEAHQCKLEVRPFASECLCGCQSLPACDTPSKCTCWRWKDCELLAVVLLSW